MELSYETNPKPVFQAFVLIFCYFSIGLCFSRDTITISQSIQDPGTIVSEGKTFILGFCSPVNTSKDRYVGIMFNNPLMTVVWVANRGKPIKDSTGSVTITADGNLVVLDGHKEVKWSSNVSSSMASSSAQLLDTGNLVLRDNSNGRIIWESFREPTDSFLQRMEIGRDTVSKENNLVTSWKSPSNPSKGTFSAGLQPLSIPQLLIWNGTNTYWRSGPWNGQIFIGVRDMKSIYLGGFAVMDDKAGSAYLSFRCGNTSCITYFKLDSSGSLLQKYWEAGSEDWKITWSAIESECDVYGICGPFGLCNRKDSLICACMQGFEPKRKDEWSKGNWSGGCIRKTALQCERNISNDKQPEQDRFLKLRTVKVPDFAELAPTLEEGCGGSCLNNCSCVAYAYTPGIGCMHWKKSLIDVQKFSVGGTDLYIRLAHSELDYGKELKVVVAAAATIGSISIAICGYFLWKRIAGHEARKQITLGEVDLIHPYESLHKNTINQYRFEELPLFDFKVLSNATNNFESASKLGQGGFGPVYKGQLLSGQEIAVKRLSESSSQGLEEFMNEVVVISRLQHRNLVRLLGCCIKRQEKMLIYEFMTNGSLDTYIFDSEKRDSLTWGQRAKIIEGIGRGLLYLHRDSRLKIIHRDLKASNILLDKEMNPKISDFGMARIFGGNQDQANTKRVVGTYGYMAPEYAMEGRFSEKSDVYSFGVLLLEIVSGRRNTSFYDDAEALSLVGYAWKLWNANEIQTFIDPKASDPRIRLEIVRYIHVGLLSVQELATDRPNVSTILSMLSSDIIELPSPKLPAFTGGRNSSEEEPLLLSRKRSSVNDVTVTVLTGR